MQNLFNLVSQRSFLLSSFIGILLCLIGFYWLERSLGLPILDVLPSYDMKTVEQNMLGYGEEGRKLYAWASLTLDVIFPLCYVVFVVGLMTLFGSSKSIRWLALVPFVLGLIDLTENIQICTMLVQFPDITDSQVSMASTTTSIKHSIVIVVYLLVALLAIYSFARWVRIQFNRD